MDSVVCGSNADVASSLTIPFGLDAKGEQCQRVAFDHRIAGMDSYSRGPINLRYRESSDAFFDFSLLSPCTPMGMLIVIDRSDDKD